MTEMLQCSPAVIADLAPTGELRAAINFGNNLLTARARGQPRRSRRDFQNHGCRVGIGFDVEPGKCERAGINKCEQAQ